MTEFAELILQCTERRKALGLTQSDVAAKMNTSQSMIAKIESGRANLTLETLAAYAETLGVDFKIKLED